MDPLRLTAELLFGICAGGTRFRATWSSPSRASA